VLFRSVSPDESPLGIGSERFLWSADSKRVLLVGKRFWVREGVQLVGGEFLYFLYDVPSRQVWCNSDSQGPPFGPNELAGYDFGESLTLRPVSESNERPRGGSLTLPGFPRSIVLRIDTEG